MRMIEQLGTVLSKILFNKETGNHKEAIENTEKAFSGLLGMDFNMIESLSVNDIKALLEISNDKFSSSVKFVIIAKLLKVRAEIKYALPDKNSKDDYQKVLELFLEGILITKIPRPEFVSFYADINEIISKIDEDIFPDTRLKVFKFFKLTGNYAKAEDELFRLKKLNYLNVEDEGIRFYRDLQKLNEAELKAGNLSIKEVEEGLKDFKTNKI